jgi:imidazolonepropionase-like amidohydrolase
MALLLHGATLIDGTGADPRAKTSVVIDGDTITSLTSTSRAAAPRGDDRSVDVSGCTLLPGLIDAHAHLGLVFNFTADPGAMSPAEIAAKTFRNCELCLEAGFTTVRDMSGVDGGLVRAIESGDVRGPRVFPSGPAIVQTGGHGHLTGPFCEFDHPLAIPGLVQLLTLCDSPDAVRLAARKNFRRGATQLKAFISGGVVSHTDRLEDTQLTVEELRAAVIEAKARKTYVAGHAHNCDAIRNGLAAGLECFEHGTMLDEATAAEMKKANASLDPTLTVCRLMADEWQKWGLEQSIVSRISGCEAMMTDSVRIAHKAGILIGSGSDLLGPGQDRRGLELVLKAKILGAMGAIVCATLNNAKIMRQSDRIGSIEIGKLADIVAVRGDPLAQPELFDDPGRIVLVVKGGEIVKNLFD